MLESSIDISTYIQCVQEVKETYEADISSHLRQLHLLQEPNLPHTRRRAEEAAVRESTFSKEFLLVIAKMEQIISSYQDGRFTHEAFQKKFEELLPDAKKQYIGFEAFLQNRRETLLDCPRTQAPRAPMLIDPRALPETKFTLREQNEQLALHKIIREGQKHFDQQAAIFAKLYENDVIRSILESVFVKDVFEEYVDIQEPNLKAILIELNEKVKNAIPVTHREVGFLGEFFSEYDALINKMRSLVRWCEHNKNILDEYANLYKEYSQIYVEMQRSYNQELMCVKDVVFNEIKLVNHPLVRQATDNFSKAINALISVTENYSVYDSVSAYKAQLETALMECVNKKEEFEIAILTRKSFSAAETELSGIVPFSRSGSASTVGVTENSGSALSVDRIRRSRSGFFQTPSPLPESVGSPTLFNTPLI